MENIQSKIKAYKELQAVIEKYPEEFNADYEVPKIKGTLQCLEMQRRFGIPLSYYSYHQYAVDGSYDNWTHVALYGENSRKIPCLDEGVQPEDEWLYCICFTRGAYIFGNYLGDHYPRKTFDYFFNELKSMGAKYVDTINNSLYFTEENSKAVYDAFWGIFNKYKAMAAAEMKEQQYKKLQDELAKMEEDQETVIALNKE